MLYQRYGNPMELLQQMLQAGSLAEFIDELGQIMWQEKADKQRWDFWLHRVDSMSFEEYVQLCEDSMHQPEGSGNLEATVKHSHEMMENFHPE